MHGEPMESQSSLTKTAAEEKDFQIRLPLIQGYLNVCQVQNRVKQKRGVGQEPPARVLIVLDPGENHGIITEDRAPYLTLIFPKRGKKEE